MQSATASGKLPPSVSEGSVQIGDRVITMQMPGIFTVAGRSGRIIEIVSDQGVALTVSDASVRRLEGGEPSPDDDASSTDG